MLKKSDLIEELGIEYKPMIDKVNIADFTKCIAQYSGIGMQYLKDSVIKEYLVKWAKNKKYIFDFIGGLKVDMPITYRDEDKDYCKKLLELGKDYPVYYPWLLALKNVQNNKISAHDIDWDTKDVIKYVFPNYTYEGTSLTHFFKSKLNAPDELVTAIGRIWENSEVTATFTMSIDPVDIMLSSENPYGWCSCYRLADDNEESHADGCLAGVIDKSTIITYIWNNHGKFSLYNKYEFKDIRYKRMRMTIAVNDNFTAVHFNSIYPGRSNLSEDFCKMLRGKVETYIAEKLNKDNAWIRNGSADVHLNAYRLHEEYGYGEYDSDYVWLLKDNKDGAYPDFQIYNETILCPCGCGDAYHGSDDCGDYENYNGEGHINDNWYENDESWEDWRVYDEDGDELYETDWGEDVAIEWAEAHGGVRVEHHWGDDYESDYDIVWEKPEEEEEEDSSQNDTIQYGDFTVSFPTIG